MKKVFFLFIAIIIVTATNSYATPVFFDDFDSGARPEWGNEYGDWYTNEDGQYDALYLGGRYPTYTYSSVTHLQNLRNFTVELDIYNVINGGVFLRSEDCQNGILLLTGGGGHHGVEGFEGLYWHIFEDGMAGARLNMVQVPGILNSDIHLKITVKGNEYVAFLNGKENPTTSLITDKYHRGEVGLYDYSEQTFDNFVICKGKKCRPNPVPEPMTMLLFGPALLGLVGFKRRKR